MVVETRALLLSGEAVVRRAAGADGAVVLDPVLPAGFLVGRADRARLRDVAARASQDFELVVQAEAIDDARAVLADWTVTQATVLSPAAPWRPEGSAPVGVVICAPPDARRLALVPEADGIRFYSALAEAIALRVVDGEVIAVCAAGDVTESLWDRSGAPRTTTRRRWRWRHGSGSRRWPGSRS